MEETTRLLEILLIFLARAGMLLVHVNTIPSTNVNMIALQHIVNISLSTLCYLCLGYKLSSVEDIFDFSSGWIITGKQMDLGQILEGWRSMIFCEGLISICIAGRAHIATDILVSFTTSSFLQPLMNNLITDGTSINSLGQSMFKFEDTTKTSVMHVFPAGFSFIASLIFGQRVVSIKDMDLSSVPINAHSTCFLGYLFMMIGFMMHNNLINSLLGASTGMLTMFIIYMVSKFDLDYWGSVWILQGGCAAVISTVWCFKPYEAIISAISTTFLYAATSRLIRSSILEDYCNILAIHGISGSLPLLLLPICQNKADLYKVFTGAIFSFCVFSIGVVSGLILLLIMKALGLLRSYPEQEIFDQKWFKTKQKLKKRGIQPGEHTIIKFKKFMGAEHDQFEGRIPEI